MKKNVFFSISVMTAFIISSGCKKVCDYIDPGAGLCQIQKVIFPDPTPGFNDTLTYSYNLVGDPVSIIRKQPGTGAPNFFFMYDKQNRLTDIIGTYSSTFSSNAALESWNRYIYDNNGRVVKDSLYFFPTAVNGHPELGEYGNLVMMYYEYDAKGRVSKYTEDLGGGNILVENYSYNQAGNRTDREYDSKVNFFRTNKIWQFINRDYSTNNPLPATLTYNSVGLPTKITTTGKNYGLLLGLSQDGISYMNIEIEYSCK